MAGVFLNNFTGGEISPEIQMRTDVTAYQTGMKSCLNFVVKPQGGIVARPGMERMSFVSSQTSNDAGVRLLPFVFNEDEAYLLVVTKTNLTIFERGQPLKNGSNNITLTLPESLTEEEVWSIDFAQSADVMTLTIPGHAPWDLKRFSPTNWTLTPINFSGHAQSPTITIGNATGSVTVTVESTPYQDKNNNTMYHFDSAYISNAATAVAAKLTPGQEAQISGLTGAVSVMNQTVKVIQVGSGVDAGKYFVQPNSVPVDSATDWGSGPGVATIKGLGNRGQGGGSYSRDYYYAVTAVYKDGEESPPSDTVSINSKSLSQTYGVYLSWSHPEPTEVDYYRVYKSDTGDSAGFGWIGDSEGNNFTDYNVAPLLSDSPLSKRVAPEKPACVTYYQQRQIFGGMEEAPLTFTASQIGNPEFFGQSRPIQDDDAFSVTARTPLFNAIQYMESLGSLILLTTGSELRTTEGDSEVFTPSTAGVRRLSAFGCAKVKPLVAGSSLLFVQPSRRRIRELAVSSDNRGYQSQELTLLARHLFLEGDGIQQLAYSEAPHNLLWCVTQTGKLYAMTYDKDQKVFAWHRHELAPLELGAGPIPYTVASIVVLPEDGEDVLYLMCVEETGSRATWLYRMAFKTDVFGVDHFIKKTDSMVTTIGPLQGFLASDQHLAVVVDGVRDNAFSVAQDGTVTLGFAGKEAYVGVSCHCQADLLPLQGQGVERDQPKNVNRITAYLHDAKGVKAGILRDDQQDPTMWEAKPRQVLVDQYGAVQPFTGGVGIMLDAPWSEDSCLRLVHDEPFGAEVLAVEYHLDA